jgi:protein phosphatase
MEYAQRSDPGRDPQKQVNEDACVRRETRLGHLCVVCDGMGGHASGREAAELAISTIADTFDRVAEGARPADTLREAIRDANRAVHTMQTSEVAFGRPGCTVVALLMHSQGTEVAHVGDSRAYLVHEGQVTRVTRDHSIVQELVDRGFITAEQAARHPDANRITRALGMAVAVEAELLPSPVAHVAGDSFVLCSDGLTDLVEDEEILSIVHAGPPAEAVGKLVDLANARGGHDNITVLVLRAGEDARDSSVARTEVISKAVPAREPKGAASTPQPEGASMPVEVEDEGVARQPAEIEREVERAGSAEKPSGAPARPTPLLLGLALAIVGAGLLGFAIATQLRGIKGRQTAARTSVDPMLVAGDAGHPVPAAADPETVVLPEAPTQPVEPTGPVERPIPKTKRRHP